MDDETRRLAREEPELFKLFLRDQQLLASGDGDSSECSGMSPPPPPPPGMTPPVTLVEWQVHMHSSGQPFYHSIKTGETVWEKPAGGPAVLLYDEKSKHLEQHT